MLTVPLTLARWAAGAHRAPNPSQGGSWCSATQRASCTSTSLPSPVAVTVPVAAEVAAAAVAEVAAEVAAVAAEVAAAVAAEVAAVAAAATEAEVVGGSGRWCAVAPEGSRWLERWTG